MGGGSFSLNVTTNIFFVPTTNGTPFNATGLTYGTVYLAPPSFQEVPFP
jgi:hypothetical protein